MNKLILKLIDIYQKARANSNKGHCRFTPTCSNYGKEAFQKFNFFKAFYLTVYRIIRCNPLSKGGYDPVPLTKKEKLLREQESSNFIDLLEDSKIYYINHI